MRQYNRAGVIVLMMVCLIFALAPSTMAAEIPDPTACDGDGVGVRKGRPGIASVEVRDGVGPTKKLVRDGIYSAAAKSSGKVSEQDKRHLCLALSPIKNPENRFLHNTKLFKTYIEAYQKTEEEYEMNFGKKRYSSYGSFRQVRRRKRRT